MSNKSITKLLQISHPIIMAPMFLVSNLAMLKAGIDAGIMGVMPTLNVRKDNELDALLKTMSEYKKGKLGSYGVNIIVQKTNILFEKHLKICVENKVPFYITSLGNPKPVIDAAQSYGAKVFCDVTNLVHAKKCADAGCDGFIAVGQGAGGHAGPNPLHILVPTLQQHFPNLPIVAAGGIANGASMLSVMAAGAAGVSIGTRFIASDEAGVNSEYKNAIVNSAMDDIVMTTKLSGTPCTIIDTPYAKKIGYEQNWLEKLLSNNSYVRKYFKMLVQLRGMKNLEASIKPGNYKTLWCAGKSVELIHDIKPCKQIVEDILREYVEAKAAFFKSDL
jgi:nitronate monooxygenase